MSLPRTVAEVLQQHVTLEIEGIDRMYLNVYVPALQRAGGIASFFRFHRGHQFASSALMDPITKDFIASMEQFAKQQNLPLVTFEKKQLSVVRSLSSFEIRGLWSELFPDETASSRC